MRVVRVLYLCYRVLLVLWVRLLLVRCAALVKPAWCFEARQCCTFFPSPKFFRHVAAVFSLSRTCLTLRHFCTAFSDSVLTQQHPNLKTSDIFPGLRPHGVRRKTCWTRVLRGSSRCSVRRQGRRRRR